MNDRPVRTSLLAILYLIGLAAVSGLVFFCFISLTDRTQAESSPFGKPELSVYTYDSFLADGGIGAEIFPLFEKKCGCHLKLLASGDGAQLVTRVQLDSERGRPAAQVILGLDQAMFERAKPWIQGWDHWTPAGYSELDPVVIREDGFLPFDYGFFSFIADQKALKEAGLKAPTRFADLLAPEWKKNLLLEDPRTSTPGLAFVLYGQNTMKLPPEMLWRKMKTQWLTLSLGWDGAYGLFMKGEAPLVWSYTTSQAYHEEQGDRPAHRRYTAVFFEDGQPLQVEGAAMVKGAFDASPEGEVKRRLAREFLEFLISPQVQRLVPKKNWMYPARKGVTLPLSMKTLERPKKVIRLPFKTDEVSLALKHWTRAVE